MPRDAAGLVPSVGASCTPPAGLVPADPATRRPTPRPSTIAEGRTNRSIMGFR
jgi:hypothetical protein